MFDQEGERQTGKEEIMIFNPDCMIMNMTIVKNTE